MTTRNREPVRANREPEDRDKDPDLVQEARDRWIWEAIHPHRRTRRCHAPMCRCESPCDQWADDHGY